MIRPTDPRFEARFLAALERWNREHPDDRIGGTERLADRLLMVGLETIERGEIAALPSLPRGPGDHEGRPVGDRHGKLGGSLGGSWKLGGGRA